MHKSNDEIKFDNLWDYMEEMGFATSEEMGLAVALCDKSSNTLEQVLFIRTGCRSLEQVQEKMEED